MNTQNNTAHRQEMQLTNIVGKENPFRVPQGYFDALPLQVMGRIRKQRQRLIALWHTGIAASLVLGLTVSGLYYYQQTSLENQTEYAYSIEELEYDVINNTEIAMYLTDAE